jgi:hypothetical protein
MGAISLFSIRCGFRWGRSMSVIQNSLSSRASLPISAGQRAPVLIISGVLNNALCSIWTPASASGKDGDGEEFDEYGAAATEVQSVGTVGCGAVPDICHVGVTGEPDQWVDGGGGSEGVFDVGKASAEFVGAGTELRALSS